MNDINLSQFIKLLNSLPSAFISRNVDIERSIDQGGDVDITVDRQRRRAAENVLMDSFGQPSHITRRSYVQSHFYSSVQIDLFWGHEWHGAIFMHPDLHKFGTYVNSDGVKQLEIAYEATVCWLTSLLAGGFFKEKYMVAILSATNNSSSEFQDALTYAAGNYWGGKLFRMAQEGRPEESAQYVTSVRRAVWLQSFRRDRSGTVHRWLQHWLTEIHLRLISHTPWIVILGPDGSGKTTVIEALTLRVAQHRLYSKVTRGHWRPGLGQRKYSDSQVIAVTDPHAKPPRSLVSSVAKLLVLLFDWTIGFQIKFADARARNQLVIFDRHFADLLIDPHRYRYGGPLWLAAFAVRMSARPDLWIVLDAPTEVLQSRKQEVTPQETERQRQEYINLADRFKNAHVVDATQPVEAIVEQVYSLLVRETARQTQEYFCTKRMKN